MSATALKSLLASSVPVGDDLRRAISVCDAWFDNEPSIGSFVVRSVLHELHSRGWTDDQGVLKSEADAFDRDVLPSLVATLDAWTGRDAQLQIKTVGDLIRDYHGAPLTPIVVTTPTSTVPPPVP
jgi:hypothetical protein